MTSAWCVIWDNNDGTTLLRSIRLVLQNTSKTKTPRLFLAPASQYALCVGMLVRHSHLFSQVSRAGYQCKSTTARYCKAYLLHSPEIASEARFQNKVYLFPGQILVLWSLGGENGREKHLHIPKPHMLTFIVSQLEFIINVKTIW